MRRALKGEIILPGIENLTIVLFKIISVFVVIDIFEFTKALASTVQGDITPKNTGGLTLNPLKHFEPIGFMLFLFMNFGWGEPVKTSMTSYKSKRRGTLITYLSPIIVSLLFALTIKYIMAFTIALGGDASWGYYLTLFLAALRNDFVLIAVMNLVPVHPMCGSRLIRCFLSPNAQMNFAQNEKMYQMIVVFLLLIGIVSPIIGTAAKLLLKIF